ncbi:unnamed protein product, partial [Ectocarpus fasciculatus]
VAGSAQQRHRPSLGRAWSRGRGFRPRELNSSSFERAGEAMARYSSASLPWALLFVACLMNPSRSFVVQQPALMRSSSAGRSSSSSSSSSSGGFVAAWGTLSSSAVHRVGRTQRYRGVGMEASAGAAAGAAAEADEQPRSDRTRIFVEVSFVL